MREGVYTETRRQAWWQGTVKETENSLHYLETNPFFLQPVRCFEQWSNVFMSALAKKNLRCVVLNFLQPVHLITVDVNRLYRAISYYGHGQCTLYRAMSYYGHGQCSLYRAMSYYGHGHRAMYYYGPCERRECRL